VNPNNYRYFVIILFELAFSKFHYYQNIFMKITSNKNYLMGMIDAAQIAIPNSFVSSHPISF